MGWRYQVGVTRACKIENGVLYIDSKPAPLQFKTQFPFNCDWQLNVFEGSGICFVLVLEDMERVCVGQETGQILLLTYDGILAGVSNWEVPLYGMDLQHMGYLRLHSGTYATYASTLDPYWVHVSRRSMLLEEPVPLSLLSGDYDDTDMSAASLAAVINDESILVADFGTTSLSAGSGQWFEDPAKGQVMRLILGEDG